MSATGATRWRALSFGELDGSVWAAALDGGAPVAMIGGGEGPGAPITALRWSSDGDDWSLGADGVELHVSPSVAEDEDEGTSQPDGGRVVASDQQLCRVRGRITLAGDSREIDCVGARSQLDGPPPAALDSARLVSAWFSDLEAVTLLALRSRSDPHSESDVIAARLFHPDGWLPVSDPRLSTTYSRDGVPMRTNLELWVGDGEHEFPRRAAGESAGAGGAVTVGGTSLQVRPLRFHSRGLEGAGVYLLADF